MGIIQIKRGLSTNATTLQLQTGELAITTDTGELYGGLATGKKLLNPPSPVTKVNGKVGDIILAKADIGLGNVDNESKATMFASPTFTGTPKAPTPVSTDNSTLIATTSFVKTVVGGITSVTGNSGTATKLQTARTISLTGAITGSVSFDGSANAIITTTVANIGDIDGGTF